MRKVILITVLVLTSHCYSQGWVQLFYAQALPYNNIYFINENTGWICAGKSEGQGYTGAVLKTFNGGSNWFQIVSDSIKFTAIQFVDNNTGFTTGLRRINSVYTVSIMKSTDGGFSFFSVYEYSSSSLPTGIQFKGSSHGYVFLNNNILLKTTNAGTNWQAVTTGANSITGGYFTAADTGFIANTFSTVLKTDNGGLNWYQVLGAGKIFWKSISFVSNMTGWVTDGNFLRRTTNGGLNWSFTPNGSNEFINFVNSSTGWSYGSSARAYISKTIDGGDSWHQQTSLYTNMNFTKLFFINQATGWAIGYLYSNPDYYSLLLKTTNGGFTFAEPVSSEIPGSYTLSQNYPNPFNPATNIEFSIPKAGFVNLTIYDALGNTIEVLQDGDLKPGTYKADWSAEGGASLHPSGIYFYRLTAGDFTQTRKMVLVK